MVEKRPACRSEQRFSYESAGKSMFILLEYCVRGSQCLTGQSDITNPPNDARVDPDLLDCGEHGSKQRISGFESPKWQTIFALCVVSLLVMRRNATQAPFPVIPTTSKPFQDGVVRIRLSECEPQKSTQAQGGSVQQVLKISANVGSVSLIYVSNIFQQHSIQIHPDPSSSL